MAIAEIRRGLRKALHQANGYLDPKPPASLQNAHLPPHELNGHHSGHIEIRPVSDPEWILTREGYNPHEQEANEAIYSLSNGYMEARASIARRKEGVHSPAAYIQGLYAEDGDKRDGPNIPGFLFVDIHNGYEAFDIDEVYAQGRLRHFRQIKDNRNDITDYDITWEDSGGRVTRIEITQLMSQGKPHLAAVQCSATLENYSGTITFRTGIDGNVDNNGKKYLEEFEKGEVEGGGIYYAARTKDTGKIVSEASNVTLSLDGQPLQGAPQVILGSERIDQLASVMVSRGKTVTIDKSVGVFSSIDFEGHDPIAASKAGIMPPRDINELLPAQQEAWDAIWADGDVQIIGNDALQRNVRFGLADLNKHAPREGEENVSHEPKGGPKAGVAYMKHIFWDTETFVLPYLIFTNPRKARAILMYRYHGLSGAREKARLHGYKGAFYAWESTDDGREATPPSVIGPHGEIIPVHNGKHEIHIGADIDDAVWKYWQVTGDREFMENYGGEIIVNIARFDTSRAEYNIADRRYEIKRVIGSDEFHEFGPDGEVGVDNDYFTNAMVVGNLEHAGEVIRLFPQLREKLEVTAEEIADWESVARKMYLLKDPETGVSKQFDGFETLHPIRLERFPGDPGKVDVQIRKAGKIPSQFQAIKQPDVIQAHVQRGMKDREQLARDFDFWEPLTAGSSSLSDPTQGVAAARLGRTGAARDYLERSASIDIEDRKGNTKDGTHIGTEGGTWRIIAEGFAGLGVEGDSLLIDPSKLPEGIQEIRFNIQFRGQKAGLRIGRSSMYISPDSENKSPIHAKIIGQEGTLEPGKAYPFLLHRNSVNGTQRNGLIFDGDRELRAAAS